jgi:hypothetical protein
MTTERNKYRCIDGKEKGRFGGCTEAPFNPLRPPKGGRYRFSCRDYF